MSPATAHEAVQPAVAAARVPTRASLSVTGADAVPFLQRLLTADIAALRTGGGCRSLLLDGHGHVLADLDVWALRDGLTIATHAGAIDAALQELGRRVLRATVTLRRFEEHVLAVHGAGAGAALRDLGLAVPPDGPYEHEPVDLAGAAVHVRRCAQVPVGLEIAAPRIETITDLLARLASRQPPVPHLSEQEAAALRIEAGVPEWGAEITGAEFPQELGLETAVCFDKGCYLGQETVARIQYRGHVNRHLCGLRLTRAATAGDALSLAGRRVGTVTSAARSQRCGAVALAWVQRNHTDVGTLLQLDGDGTAEVVAPPFA